MELSGQPHASAALLQGKKTPGWVGFSINVGNWEIANSLTPAGRPPRNLVTVPTELVTSSSKQN